MQSRLYNECSGHVKVQTGGYNLVEPCDGNCKVVITCQGHGKWVGEEHVTIPCDGTCNALNKRAYVAEPIPPTGAACYYSCGILPFVLLSVNMLAPNPDVTADFRLCYCHYKEFCSEFVGNRVAVNYIYYNLGGTLNTRKLTPLQRYEGRAVIMIIDLAFNMRFRAKSK